VGSLSGKSKTGQGKRKARKKSVDIATVAALIQALAALIVALTPLLKN